MDNTSLWYRAQYGIAVELARRGKRLDALQICWNLRDDPCVSLYRRAWVNLMIASLASVRSHPDKSKFAEEAIALAAQIRRNMTVDETDEAELQRIEAEGRSRLAAIEEEKFIYAAMEGSKTREEAFAAKDIATTTIKEMKQNGSWPVTAAADVASVDAAPAAVSSIDSNMKEIGGDMQEGSPNDNGALNTWTVEGAFTDFGKGQAKKNAGIVIKVEDEQDEENRAERELSAASEISLPVQTRGSTDSGLSTPPPTSPVRSSVSRSPTASPGKHGTMSLRVGKGGQKKGALDVDWTQSRQLTYSEALKKNLEKDKQRKK